MLLTMFSLTLCMGFVMSTDFAFADSDTDSLKAAMLQDGDRPDDAVQSDFRTAVRGFINYFLSFLGLIAVAMVIYAGVLMVTSGGEEEQSTKGKQILIWAAVGLVLIMLSYAIVSVVLSHPVQ